MRAARRWVAAVAAVALLLVLPGASALQGDGQVQADLPTLVQGQTELTARDGQAIVQDAFVSGQIADGRIRLTEYTFEQRYRVDAAGHTEMLDTQRRTRTWAPDDAEIHLDGVEATVIVETADDLTLRTDDDVLPATAVDRDHRSAAFHATEGETIRAPVIGDVPTAYRTTIPEGQLGFLAARPSLDVHGALSTYIYDADVRIETDDRQRRIETGSNIYSEGADGRVEHETDWTPSPTDAGAGVNPPSPVDADAGVFLVYETTYVVVQARPTDAATPHLSLDTGEATQVLADAMTLDVDGNLRFDGADGQLSIQDRTYEFEDKRVLVRGDVTVEPQANDDGRASYDVRGDVSYMKIGQRTHDFEDEGIVALAIGVALGTAGLLAYAWPALKFALFNLIAAPLYTRIKEDEVLGHDVRQAIYDIVTADPGVSISTIADRADVGWGTAVYHLGVLEDNDLVVSMRDGRYKRYYQNGGRFNGTKEALAAIQNETTRDVVEVVIENPGITQTGLCDQLGISAPLAHWHLDRLKEADVVEQERDGRYKRHYVPDGTRQVLTPHLT